MSNYQFLNHQSPVRKAPLAAQGVMSPSTHISAQQAPPKALYKQQSTPNIQGYRNIQVAQWGDIAKDFYNHIHSEVKQRDISPLRYNPREGKNVITPQYNYYSGVSQKRDSVGLSNFRAERTPQHIRINRDVSPFHRNVVVNEGVEYPPRAVKIENRGIKVGEREGSWNKLLNRSQEQAIVRNQKNNDWRKVLDEQVRERQMKKQIEEERKRTQELEEENRYQRQIEELSSEYNKRKISLQKNGVLKQEPNNVHQPGNASPLGQLSSNLSNSNTKSMKDMRINRESPVAKMFSPFPAPKNIREIRGKVNLKEEDSSSIHVSYSIENRSRNENLNQYIENLKAELYQGQEVFKSHIHDLKQEVYKLGKFRNIVGNPIAEPRGHGFMKGIGTSLPAQMIYKDVHNFEDNALPLPNIPEPKVKPRKVKAQPVVQEEEKFKWDTDDDFYSKLPLTSKEVLTGVQTMVKIEPVTEQLLAYKKPETPKKKWFDEEIQLPPKKENIFEEKKAEIKDNKLLAPLQTNEADLRILPSFSSITEIKGTPKSTPKGGIGPNIQDDLAQDLLKTETQSKPDTHITIPSPRIEEKPLPEKQDFVEIAKDLQQPLNMMLNNPNLLKDGTITPSLEYGSRREPEIVPNEKLVAEKNKIEQQRVPSRNENLMHKEKETIKVRRPMLVDRERQDLGNSRVKSREVKNAVPGKNGVALKAMTKFVAKDGLDAKISGDQKLQADPLARLDFMIDYLFNYNP